jgi:hypothetical protein
MKRFLLSALMLGVTGIFAGCDETSKVETKTKVETPTGSVTKTTTDKETKTGSEKTDAAKAP